jgi:hypothetical protein
MIRVALATISDRAHADRAVGARVRATLSEVDQPRFVALDPSHLIELAQHAEPPVAVGDRARITCGTRSVTLEAQRVDLFVEWIEIDAGDRSR